MAISCGIKGEKKTKEREKRDIPFLEVPTPRSTPGFRQLTDRTVNVKQRDSKL